MSLCIRSKWCDASTINYASNLFNDARVPLFLRISRGPARDMVLVCDVRHGLCSTPHVWSRVSRPLANRRSKSKAILVAMALPLDGLGL